MNIYHYDTVTKEYKGVTTAEADPMETKIKGEFVPLIPGCATLIEPPGTGVNEAAVFENGEWVIKPDYRGYFKVNDNLTLDEIKEINETAEILVDREEAELIQTNPNHFKIENGNLIEKTADEIEAEEAEREKTRIAQLKLTKREVFLGLYKAKGITPETLKAQITDPESLIEFEYANEYYRGNPLIDTIGAMLGFTSKQLDEFFETNDYTKLLAEE